MGTFKAYGGLRAVNFARASTGISSQTPNYYTINNATAIKTIYMDNRGEMTPFKNMVAIATADELDDFSVDDYKATPLGTTSTTCSIASNPASGVITATVSIAASAEATVKCIKFVSPAGWFGATSPGGTNNQHQNILLCGYFFDKPVILDESNNYSAQVVVNFYA